MCHTNWVSGISQTPKVPSVSTWNVRPGKPANGSNGAGTRRQLQTDSTCPPSFAAAYIPRWGEAAAVEAGWFVKKNQGIDPLFMAHLKTPKPWKKWRYFIHPKNIHIIHGTDWYIYLDELLIFMVNGVVNIAVTLRIWHKNEAFTKKPVR